MEKKNPDEWGYNPAKSVSLTKKQYDDFCARIIEAGKSRNQAGTLASEADFLCGAMAAMNALNINCPVWPFAIMAGNSLLK